MQFTQKELTCTADSSYWGRRTTTIIYSAR